jgi:hypothetical protein
MKKFLSLLIAPVVPLLLIVLLLNIVPAAAGDIGKQFVTVKLAHGASIDIPKSWHIRHGNEKIVIETMVGAAIDLSGSSTTTGGSELLLSSSFPDNQLYAGAHVTSNSLPGCSRSSATSLNESQLKSAGQTIRQATEAVLAQLGGKTWGWTPIKIISLGGYPVLEISYLRASDIGDFRVHIYKFFGTNRIYDVVLSTTVAAEKLNSVILKKILGSVTVQ